MNWQLYVQEYQWEVKEWMCSKEHWSEAVEVVYPARVLTVLMCSVTACLQTQVLGKRAAYVSIYPLLNCPLTNPDLNLATE